MLEKNNTKNNMKNNIASNNNDPLSKSWSSYKFTCPHEDCELLTSSYIGMTRNTINKRLEQHCKDGAIKEHLRLKHQQNSSSELLQQNTCPAKQLRDTKRLFIYEALTIILKERPFINWQKDNFINPLKLYSITTTLNQSQSNNSTSTNHPKTARTPNAISLDASEKERLLELMCPLIFLLSAHTSSERAC